MEQEIKCKSLYVSYNESILDGTHIVEFDLEREIRFHIVVEQCGIREIKIKSDEDVSVFELNKIFTRVERLLMLLEGFFLPLSNMEFTESDTSNEDALRICKENLLNRRLSYFNSADFCKFNENRLLDFDVVLTNELYDKWEKLLDELDVVHQMYLYAMSDNGITRDVNCAFLIELAEPLIEIVKKYTNFFSSLTPGVRGTSLKNCLDAIITKYGEDIFKSELSDKYDQFLTAMINSRVRIMHIKREQKGIYFNGSESRLYALKMSLLYRRILFEVLNINEVYYKDNLINFVSIVEKWNNTLEQFISKLSG